MKFKILATLLSLSFFAFSQDDSKQLEKIYDFIEKCKTVVDAPHQKYGQAEKLKKDQDFLRL